MGRKIRKLYIWMRIRLRLVRLFFVRLEAPEDARTPQEMLEEIKKRGKDSELT